MTEKNEYKYRFNQYRIIHTEGDYIVAESSPISGITTTKTICKLIKNHISNQFTIDQVLLLRVEHLSDNTHLPIGLLPNGITLNTILQLEEQVATDLKVNEARILLDAGEVDDLRIEMAIFALISYTDLSHNNVYKTFRSKLLRNQDALIRAVADNNGHIDYPKHETNPRFIQICKSYLHSINFEDAKKEIDTNPFKRAIPYAKLFSQV